MAISFLAGKAVGSGVATVRGHQLRLGVMEELGGDDGGIMPTEALAVALAACLNFFLSTFLARQGIDPSGTRIEIDSRYAADKSRVESLAVTVKFADHVPADLRPAAERAANACIVRQTLQGGTTITETFV
ncbi:OsmC family protein [bacterium]|nr:OsmC family protein [bacterium]